MKTLHISILLMVSLTSISCAGNIFDDMSSLEKDKYVHFTTGVMISHISYPFFKKRLNDKNKATWYSFLLSVILSAAKEAYDTSSTGFNGADLTAGTLGASTIFIVSFD